MEPGQSLGCLLTCTGSCPAQSAVPWWWSFFVISAPDDHHLHRVVNFVHAGSTLWSESRNTIRYALYVHCLCLSWALCLLCLCKGAAPSVGCASDLHHRGIGMFAGMPLNQSSRWICLRSFIASLTLVERVYYVYTWWSGVGIVI